MAVGTLTEFPYQTSLGQPPGWGGEGAGFTLTCALHIQCYSILLTRERTNNNLLLETDGG